MAEKPLSVHKAEGERLVAAHHGRRQVYAVMFNQRTDPHSQKIRHPVPGGGLGEVRRVNRIVTDWFRPGADYA